MIIYMYISTYHTLAPAIQYQRFFNNSSGYNTTAWLWMIIIIYIYISTYRTLAPAIQYQRFFDNSSGYNTTCSWMIIIIYMYISTYRTLAPAIQYGNFQQLLSPQYMYINDNHHPQSRSLPIIHANYANDTVLTMLQMYINDNHHIDLFPRDKVLL